MIKLQNGFYLENIKSKKSKISNEEMFQSLEELEDEDAEEVLSDLVKFNIGLIHFIIRRRWPDVKNFCDNYRITYDDLFSTGIYGLWKAVLTYEYSKGNKFATYAARVIHNEFGMFIRKNKRRWEGEVSFDDTLHVDMDGNELTLLDVVPDGNNEFESLVINEFNDYFLNEFNKTLSERELVIVKLYFYGELTEIEIAKSFGLSQSYISRIKKRIIEKGKKFYRKIDKIS